MTPPLAELGIFWTWDFIEMAWTWDFLEAELPPKNSSKQVEYEKYWYKINQYEWYNGIFGHV